MRAIRLWAAAFLVSFACVTVVERIFVLRWWHPACAAPDGPAPYTIGFPLPYVQWRVGFSVEYWVSVPVLIVDICILSVPIFFVINRLFSRRLRYRAFRSVVAFAIIGLSGAAALLGILILHESSYPAVTLANNEESFFQYRPVFFYPPKGKACDIYD
ncbi:hypothetical protein ACSBM8_18880 [Sphingomonas sp. ASY06-1R]|uniref:hypothetical protein n=1 Tax=Sphingomonas sp. ASY06-1R TaxID=3445771 RepID=UPI003FA1F060